jgi:hypothetical protein
MYKGKKKRKKTNGVVDNSRKLIRSAGRRKHLARGIFARCKSFQAKCTNVCREVATPI